LLPHNEFCDRQRKWEGGEQQLANSECEWRMASSEWRVVNVNGRQRAMTAQI